MTTILMDWNDASFICGMGAGALVVLVGVWVGLRA